MGFDKVGLLDSGVLVEFDSPANLLAWPSTFKKLYEGAAAVPAAELEASTA